MKGVDTRVEGAHYFARVFLEDKERFDSCLIVVRENENPTEVLEKKYSERFQVDWVYPIQMQELILALRNYDDELRKDHTPRGIAQVADLEGEVKFEGISESD